MIVNRAPATTRTQRSHELHQEAKRWAPLGVQGDARYFLPYPIYMSKAEGAHLYDVDGNQYLDLWAAAGPIILGHTYRPILEAIRDTMEQQGTLFCLPHPREVDLARRLCELVPSAEKVVFGCGGSDVTFFAVRAARAFTGRSKLVKFEGAYHGWHDPLLVSVRPSTDEVRSESPMVPIPASSGLPSSTTEDVFVLPYNDITATERLLSARGDEIAALVVEPILHTQGCIPPAPGFLEYLRTACDQHGIVLVFDEIITGFRHGLGGVQQHFNVIPDLTALGKAMANGFPISALVGRDDIMSVLTPEGPAYYSGTYMGYILGVTAALKTIEALEDGEVHRRIFNLGDKLTESLHDMAARLDVPVRCQHFGSAWTVYFTDREVTNYKDVLQLGFPKAPADIDFRQYLLQNGIYHHPPAARAYFCSEHSDDDLDRIVGVIEAFLRTNSSTLRSLRKGMSE